MALSENKLKYFADYIQKEIGIIYSPQVYFQLEQRLEKIALYLGVESAEQVYDRAIQQGITGDFKQYLLDISTNNETSFFRDPKIYEVIQKQIFPTLKTKFPHSISYRIWCCAASFGQEPYSVAMLAHEFLRQNPGHPPIQILATDIADHALKRCNEGLYSQLEVQRGLSAPRLVQFFTKENESHWRLNSEVKRLVEFRKHNLLDSFSGMGTFHLILCRYVLIYQDAEKKKEIVQRLVKCLVPEGFMILGGSESMMGLSTEMNQIAENGAIYYQKKS